MLSTPAKIGTTHVKGYMYDGPGIHDVILIRRHRFPAIPFTAKYIWFSLLWECPSQVTRYPAYWYKIPDYIVHKRR